MTLPWFAVLNAADRVVEGMDANRALHILREDLTDDFGRAHIVETQLLPLSEDPRPARERLTSSDWTRYLGRAVPSLLLQLEARGYRAPYPEYFWVGIWVADRLYLYAIADLFRAITAAEGETIEAIVARRPKLSLPGPS